MGSRDFSRRRTRRARVTRSVFTISFRGAIASICAGPAGFVAQPDSCRLPSIPVDSALGRLGATRACERGRVREETNRQESTGIDRSRVCPCGAKHETATAQGRDRVDSGVARRATRLLSTPVDSALRPDGYSADPVRIAHRGKSCVKSPSNRHQKNVKKNAALKRRRLCVTR